MENQPAAVIEVQSSSRWLRPVLITTWSEFIFITTLLLVLPIRGATLAALHGSGSRYMQLFLNNHRLTLTGIYEALALVLFLAYLRWRGWRMADLRFGFAGWSTVQALGLFVLAQVVAITTLFASLGMLWYFHRPNVSLFALLWNISPHIRPHSIHVDWSAIFFAMIVNAFLEEIACMGYVFNEVAARWGPMPAIVFTVFVRAACHVYQDPLHVASIAALFTVYAVWYCFLPKLWPLVLAHILLDVGSLGFLKEMFG